MNKFGCVKLKFARFCFVVFATLQQLSVTVFENVPKVSGVVRLDIIMLSLHIWAVVLCSEAFKVLF